MMKGQYRILSEMILFGLGVLITVYVIVNFANVEDTVREITLYDQLEGVSDLVAEAVLKASQSENTSIRLRIPIMLSDEIYKISIKDADGGKVIINTLSNDVRIERQLFNINYDNVINNSEVVSTAQYVEILKNEQITIQRVSVD